MEALLRKYGAELKQSLAREERLSQLLLKAEYQQRQVEELNQALAAANANLAELTATLEERNEHLKMTNQHLSRANAYAAELVALVEVKEEEITRLNKALAEANAQAAELIAERDLRMEELEHLNRCLAAEMMERKRAQEEAASLAEQLRKANEQLDRLATLDPLTDLYNRRGLARLLTAELDRSARTGSPIGVLFADFDDFKSINERFGHSGGDQALREAAIRLRHCLRSSDIVGRIGGDEFMAILPGAGDGEIDALAERFLRSVREEPVIIQDQAVFLTISVAAGVLPEAITDVDAILAWTAGALKASKEGGKNRFTRIHSTPRTAVSLPH